jgi:serine/threonine protein kinase
MRASSSQARYLPGMVASVDPLAADDPRQVGGFRLQARLGAGGMGRVYLGYSPGGRPVAVKVVHPDLARDPEFMVRFHREVAAAQTVSDAYTAAVVGAGPEDSPPWLATTYVPGPPLADLVTRAGPLPEDAVWRLAGGLAEALDAIHAQGLIHRDLKPGNILVAADGPRVIDFGISRTTSGTVLTATRTTIGTPAYMSPEQAEGRPVGPPSDVFSLGSVLAFAAAGVAPFGSGEPFAVGYRVVHGQPDLGRVPASLRPLLLGCLAKEAGDRPTVDELVRAVAVAAVAYPEVTPGRFWPDQVAAVLGSAAFTPALPPLDPSPPPGRASLPAPDATPVTPVTPAPAPSPVTAPARSGTVASQSGLVAPPGPGQRDLASQPATADSLDGGGPPPRTALAAAGDPRGRGGRGGRDRHRAGPAARAEAAVVRAGSQLIQPGDILVDGADRTVTDSR